MTTDQKREFINRAKKLRTRPSLYRVDLVDVSILYFDGSDDRIKVYVTGVHAATIWSCYSEWPREDLAERALCSIRELQVLDDLARV